MLPFPIKHKKPSFRVYFSGFSTPNPPKQEFCLTILSASVLHAKHQKNTMHQFVIKLTILILDTFSPKILVQDFSYKKYLRLFQVAYATVPSSCI